MISYELALNTTGLKQFIFYGPRNDIISANREGIFSSAGYLSLALIGMTFGRMIYNELYFQLKESEDEKKVKSEIRKNKESRMMLKLAM